MVSRSPCDKGGSVEVLLVLSVVGVEGLYIAEWCYARRIHHGGVLNIDTIRRIDCDAYQWIWLKW